MPSWNKIVICCCAGRGWVIPENIKFLCASAKASGIKVELHADFCRIAAEHPEMLREMAESGHVLIGGCLSRAMKAIFTAAGTSLPPTFLDLRSTRLTPEKLRELGIEPVEAAGSEPELPVAGAGWSAWFPVIDRERCINCGKCLDFCLFGVYDFNAEKQVCVVNPANCKNNCPACARVCPRQAVIFPKYDSAPINGGEIDESKQNSGIDKADVDLYKKLAERKKLARKLFRDKDSKE